VSGAPYAQEYGGGQTGKGSSDGHRRRLHDRRTQSMGKAAQRGYDPTSWLVYKEDCGSPTRGARVETKCILRGSSSSRTPIPFSLVAVEHLLPRSAPFALVDYKVPARAYTKKSIQKGRNPLWPNYVGRIGRKPVYETDGPLESMDDILLRTERGVR
jgi:hypothetical protein